MLRVGIVGGTFNPIHLGHLILAEEARIGLDLEEVLFMPAGEPWMKEGEALSPAHHRLNMTRLAVSSNPYFRVSSTEIDRPGATYTVDTLEQLHRDTVCETDFTFIIGADSLKEFPRWKEPARVLELCILAVAPRPGSSELDTAGLEAVGPGASERLVQLKGPMVDISGTEIRRRAALGLSVRYQVPEEVGRYMHHYGLYRPPEATQ